MFSVMLKKYLLSELSILSNLMCIYFHKILEKNNASLYPLSVQYSLLFVIDLKLYTFQIRKRKSKISCSDFKIIRFTLSDLYSGPGEKSFLDI